MHGATCSIPSWHFTLDDYTGLCESVTTACLVCSVRLGVEDGTSYRNAQELKGNVRAVCTHVGLPKGQTHSLLIAAHDQDPSVLVCQPPEGDVCTAAGPYQVTCRWLLYSKQLECL